MPTVIDSRDFSYRFLCWGAFLFILVAFFDRAIPEGMFFDGVTYASLSRNLAEGKGSLWSLYFRGDGPFVEHPPLHMGLQSLFFLALGDHLYTERIYCLSILIFTLGAMMLLWRRIPYPGIHRAVALPIFCWGLIPTVIWSYPNNLLDATMAMFTLWSVYFVVRAMQSKTSDRTAFWISLAGLHLFGATLTKGPVGLFPLTAPLLYALFVQREQARKGFYLSLALFGLLIVFYGLLGFWPGAWARLGDYLNLQVFMALSGKREKVETALGRWDLLREMTLQLSPMLGLMLIFILWSKIRSWRLRYSPSAKSMGVFFLLVGLSASLPILASIKQRSFYLLPAFPFFSLAAGVFLWPYVENALSRVKISGILQKGFIFVAFLLSFGSVGYLTTKFGQIGRDQALIQEIKKLPDYIPLDEKIGICQSMERAYSFLSYGQRYIHLETRSDYHRANYILLDKSLCQGSFDQCLSKLSFEEQPTSLDRYRLYRKKSGTSKSESDSKHQTALLKTNPDSTQQILRFR